MKIRVYNPFFPYPPTEGGFVVAYEQLRALSALGAEVELVYWRGEHRLMPIRAAIEPRGPCPLQESAAARTLRVMRSLFSPLSSPELFHYPPRLARVRAEEADWGIYHYSFAYPWLRRGDRPEKKIAVLFHNLESDLAAERGSTLHSLNARKLARHEIELGALADELWFLSPRDLEIFTTRAIAANSPPRARLRLVPPTFSAELARDRATKFVARAESPVKPILGFVGGMDFQPNLDSVQWILRELVPALKQQGFTGEIHIIGRGAPEWLKTEAARTSFVKLRGFVTSLDEFWASLEFMLVPHVSGSGVRIKLLEALVSGVPSLTTLAGRDRLHPDFQAHPQLFAADSAEEWATWIMTGHISREPGGAESAASLLTESWQGELVYGFMVK